MCPKIRTAGVDLKKETFLLKIVIKRDKYLSSKPSKYYSNESFLFRVFGDYEVLNFRMYFQAKRKLKEN